MSPVRILRRRALHLITRITGAAIMCVDGVAKDMPVCGREDVRGLGS